MRGRPLYNFPLFDRIRNFLRSRNYDIICPAEMDRNAGFDPAKLPNDWDWWELPDHFHLEDAYDRDVEGIKKCDGIVMLPEWRTSYGARAEFFCAKWLGKKTYTMKDGEVVPEEYHTPMVHEFEQAVESMHPACKPFVNILLESLALHTSKSKDYGTGVDPYANVRASEDFGCPAWIGSLIRAHDKIVRLKSFTRKGVLEHESAEDSLMDLCVYFPIILMLYREQLDHTVLDGLNNDLLTTD